MSEPVLQKKHCRFCCAQRYHEIKGTKKRCTDCRRVSPITPGRVTTYRRLHPRADGSTV